MHCRKVVKVQKHAIGKLIVEVYPITVLVQLVFPDSPNDDKIHYEVSRDDTVGKRYHQYTYTHLMHEAFNVIFNIIVHPKCYFNSIILSS